MATTLRLRAVGHACGCQINTEKSTVCLAVTYHARVTSVADRDRRCWMVDRATRLNALRLLALVVEAGDRAVVWLPGKDARSHDKLGIRHLRQDCYFCAQWDLRTHRAQMTIFKQQGGI